LFPAQVDFFQMLARQAAVTSQGVESFCLWLEKSADADGIDVLHKEREADAEHRQLEAALVQAFSTPIERGDLYDISRQLDQMLDHVRDTLHEAAALDVLPPQPHYARFSPPLRDAMRAFAAAVDLMSTNPAAAEAQIPVMREATKRVRQAYWDCLHSVAHETDVNLALRQREVYHHLRDVGLLFDRMADVLHRVIVRVL
jgi:uncharacterized protein Yka (UPF0111/DUF47 family)